MRSTDWVPADKIDWDLLALDGYHPLTQAWAWGEAKRESGSRVERYILGGRTAVQLERRRGGAWAAGAPIGATDEGTGVALSRLAERLRRPILLSPSAPIPGLGTAVSRGLFLSGTVYLDLQRSAEELRSGFDKRWRNGLSKATRSDTQVEDGSLDELISMLGDLADRKGFEVPYGEPFLHALQPAFGAACTIRIARLAGASVGAWMDLRAGSTVTYLLGATTEKGRAVNASYLLLWDAIERHRGGQSTLLDLGGIGLDRTSGTSGFKVRTGGRVVDFPGTYVVGRSLKAHAVKAWLGLRRLSTRFAPSASPTTEP